MSLSHYFKTTPLHPLIFFAASITCGIIAQSQAASWTPLVIAAGISLLYVATKPCNATKKSLEIKTLFGSVALAFFALGALRYSQQENSFHQFHNKTMNKKFDLVAVITDTERNFRRPGQTVVTARLKTLTNKRGTLCSNRKIKITTYQKVLNRTGDTVTIPGIYFRQIDNSKYQRYLIKENLGAYIYTKNPITTIERPLLSLKRWGQSIRNKILYGVKNKLSPKGFALFAGIFLGKRLLDPNSIEPIRNKFRAWGILHYLARSGLHLLIIILGITFLMKLLPLPFFLKEVILLFFLLLYMAFSWTSISFSRACTVFILYKMCTLLNLQINIFYLLLLTCITTLLFNPIQLFFLDFQLSFGFTLALTWFSASQSIASYRAK